VIRRMFYALAAIACVLVVACDDNQVAPSTIVGGSWELMSIQTGGGAPVMIAAPDRYTAQFGDDGRVAVKSDCNSCGGSYSLAGSNLTVGPLACTKVFCGERSFDSQFTAALDGTGTASVDDNELVVRSGDVTLRFED
jgi:heat shock protein HslJ